jgi:hypothetical protein
MEEFQLIYRGQNLSNKLMNILNQTPVNIDIDQRLRDDFIIHPSSDKKCYIDINTLDQPQTSYNSDENDDAYLEIFKDDEFIMSEPSYSSSFSPQSFEKENERQQIQNPVSSILIDENNELLNFIKQQNFINSNNNDDLYSSQPEEEPPEEEPEPEEEESSLSMIRPYSLQLQSQLNNVLQQNSNENENSLPVRLSELKIGDEIKLDPKNVNQESTTIPNIISSLSYLSKKSNTKRRSKKRHSPHIKISTTNSKKRKPSLIFTGRKSAIKHRKINGGNKRRTKTKTQKRK